MKRAVLQPGCVRNKHGGNKFHQKNVITKYKNTLNRLRHAFFSYAETPSVVNGGTHVLTSLQAGKARPGWGSDPTGGTDPLFRPMGTHYAAAVTSTLA
jgi:hypothetical protein